ncbi:MAG: hypothetical protein LQ352_007018 [Teloschistes flavicans]|nr:MAG: hypothetical protein LQ352_007018 [Teloschistes flavicans]
MSFVPSAGGQPPSFKTNVNRAKTKRWVEAKSYSYDGDDWGEMDEYDEYGGYDEPAPPPRPTGLRQRGQSANRDQPGMYQQQQQQPGYGNPAASQHGYPNMGPQGSTQQPQSARSVTNPPYQTSRMPRPGSFDHGDERRAFSAAMPHQGGVYPGSTGATRDYPHDSPVPQNHQSQQESPDLQQSHPAEAQEPQFSPERHHPPSMDNRPPLISDQPRRTSMGSRTQSMTSNTPSVDFHNRRDFSPSAVPPPLHTRGSPSPHNRADANSAWRPPRKSSLGQNSQLDRGYDSHDAMPPAQSDLEEKELPNRGRADSDTNKALPFVRPVDIYRRMQEEKERQRQSQESSRPSMDAIIGDPHSEDEPTRNSGRGLERGQEVEPARRSRSTLDPVAERQSEYGMSGLPQHERESRGGPSEHQTPGVGEMVKPAESQKLPQSFRPQLPDVARMSGFGELFGKPALRSEDTPNFSMGQGVTSGSPDPPQLSGTQPDNILQHQPSLGLRSVVHQAFDTPNDPVPETPSSSTADSSIGRSGSGGTSAVSPIISRGSSSVTANLQSRGPSWRPETPQAGHEPEAVEVRPTSSDSLGTPTAISRKLSPDFANPRPGSFIPGHRRDLSTPSPDNSPARTPAVEANKQLQQPQEAELAMTTPIESQFPLTNDPYGQSFNRTSPTKPFDTGTTDLHTQRTARGVIVTTGSTGPSKSTPTEAPKSPAESTRSRVRNLADKFESGRSSPAGSERAPSPVKSNFISGPASQQPRPLAADRMESFRPKLPGGWESSASLTALEAPGKTETPSAPASLEQRMHNTATYRSGQSAAPAETKDRQVKPDHGSDSKPLQAEDETSASDPFASLAAAGSALAGAFSSAMGSGNGEGDKDLSSNQLQDSSQQLASERAQKESKVGVPREDSGDTAFLPEASKPAGMLDTPDDGTSSIMPTPLDKLPESAPRQEGKATDYFGGGIVPKQQWSGDSYRTEKTTSTERSQLTPALSIDTGPQYESDRLRREIIRELSPRVTSEPTAAESSPPGRGGPTSQSKSNVPSHPHESMVIPLEYDSYWNGSGSEESSRASSVRNPSKTANDIMGKHDEKENTASPLPIAETQPIQQTTQGRPDLQPHRFSFEGPIEPIGPGQGSLHDVPDPVRRPDSRSPSLLSQPIDSSLPPHNPVDHPSIHPDDDSDPIPLEETNTTNTGSIDPTSAIQGPSGSDLAGILRDLPPEAAEAHPHLGPEQQTFDARTDRLPQSSHTISTIAPRSAQPNLPPKIQNFREILALKNPRDRINCYNECREHSANIETGLAHWLAVTVTKLPEHQDVLPSGRLPGTAGPKPSPARSKLGGLLSSGNSSTPQPHYQQYLSASSPAGNPEGAPPRRGNSTSGYSPSTSTSKLSTQQVQARGKDLLHSAGVFGGKANVAAKGLFSKGKSKLRGGNADKAPISSFNTNYTQGAQPQTQPLGSFQTTPRSRPISERPPSSKQSTSSRSTSFVVPLEHDPSGTSRQETRQELQSAPQISLRGLGNDHFVTDPSSDSGRTGSSKPSIRLAPVEVTPSEGASPTDEGPGIRPQTPQQTRESAIQDATTFDQVKEVQVPQPAASSNRTPTQEDYADYLRRGSSPTIQIPEVKKMETNQERLNGENTAQKTAIPHYTSEPHSTPALRSKYSTQKSGEVSSSNTNRLRYDHEPPLTGPRTTSRGSDDSEGTFRTAGSAINQPADRTGADIGQNVPGQGREHSVEPSEEESSTSGSIKETTPIAVPAANIQDQPRARPFSFIQFSQNTTPQPLVDHSHRRPSVDSIPSQLDSEQDVPPSPVSSRRSVVHEPMQPQMSGPTTHRPDHPQPLRRSLQSSSLRGHPAYRQDRNTNSEEDMPAQHYPTPLPRAETVVPRQQVTEYSLEGVGPPPVPRGTTHSTSTSKRGSRSSAFFRSFKNPTETAAPATLVERDRQDDDRNQGEPTIRKTRSKRGSLFRSLTKGSKASSSEDAGQRSQESPQPANTSAYPAPVNPAPAAENVSRDETPTTAPSKSLNRLSKTATVKEAEQRPQEPGKKKRFSAIGSLFGRSKDRGRSSTQSGIPQQVPESAKVQDVRLQDGNKRLSTSARPGINKAPIHEKHHQSTRDSLVKEGLLPRTSRQSSSKSIEPSAYSQDSAQRQRAFPPRDQSLGHGGHQTDRRPPQIVQPQPPSSLKTRQQSGSAPQNQQRHSVQSSVTTRSTSRPSGPPPPDPNRRVLSYTTTTTTSTNGRMPHTTTTTYEQSSNNNSYIRSNSPPPPPPPPKDVWRQPKLQQQSSITTTTSSSKISGNSNERALRSSVSNSSPAQGLRDLTNQSRSQQRSSYDDRSPAPVASNSVGPHLQTMNYWKPGPQGSNMGNPSQEEPYHAQPPRAQEQPRQPLPPLQTSMPSRATAPAQSHVKNNSAGSDLEARKVRRSQIESGSATTPGTEQTRSSSAVAPAGLKEGGNAKVGGGKEVDNDDEPVVMSATSFPGQEWQPMGYGGWDEY